MATVYSSIADGYVNANNADWATARDATTGGGSANNNSSASEAIKAQRAASRGGGYTYTVSRAFMFFSTAGITSNVASATLKIYGYSQNSANSIAIKATSDIGTITTADINSITGWSTGSADGSGAGDNESNVTKYSDELTSWSTSGYNDFTLTSAALANMRDDNYLYVCIMETVHDLRDITPTSNLRNGLYFTDNTGTSKDPYIDYTLAPTATDNSVFFGCNF
jgi:hypothetical protein